MLSNNNDKHTPIGEIKERPSPAKRGTPGGKPVISKPSILFKRIYD